MTKCLAYAAVSAALVVVPMGAATAASDEGNTLNWPVGNHAWIGARGLDLINTSKASAVVFDDVVSVGNAAWLRLYFGEDTKLGADSFIRVTSLRDGEVQELDSATLAMWSNTSAYFNGNSVRVEIVAGGLTNNQLSIDTATWEAADSDRGDNCGICGADDRVPSSDNRFARLYPTGCSATMYNAESCFVTAGHCLASGDVLQFNVPDSSSNCYTNSPPVADQFPITGLDGVSGGVGNDYGAVKAGTNSDGQTPYERYGAFVDIAGSVPGSGNLTVNGYGVDDECVRSQTQQFCEGPLDGTNSDTLYYNLDVTYGNSGSSILYNGEIIGVVTHCSYSCENYGTRIDKSGFVSVRDDVCAGGGGGGGDCAAGEIEDCNGNCCPDYWVGDGYCDDGTYSWNGVPIYLNCAEFDCDGGDCVCDEVFGGCCVGTDCSLATEADCASSGGTYLGDNTDCSGDPCGGGGGEGACCIGTDCVLATPADCSSFGGSYQGDGTDCTGNPCGGGGGGEGDNCSDAIIANEGANPFDTSNMSDSGYGEPDETQCDGTYLDWLGSPDQWFVWTPGADGTATFHTCDASSYDTSLVLYEGASCSSLVQIACNGDYDDSTGCQAYHSQIDNVTVTGGQSYYVRIGGWQAATGAGTLTIDADLGTPEQGACCINGSCSYVTEAACYSGNGVYQGNGVPCSPDPCAAPATGGCCIAGVCYTMTETECTLKGGTYQGDDAPCDPDPCGTPETGACCVGTSCSGSLTEIECLAINGTYQGDGTTCASNPCDTGGGDDVSVTWSIVGVDLTALDQPHYTVDIFVDLPAGWRLDAVAGNEAQQKTLTSSTSFYQDGYGGPTSLGVNPEFYELAPDLEWDSRVGIGSIDASGYPYPANGLNDIGIDWDNFEAGGDVSADNGVWFIIPDDPAGAAAGYTSQNCDERQGVWVARLTTMELSSEIMFDALLQGRDATGEVWQQAAGATATYQGEQDCNANHVPDACDIANGTSEDANNNGVPDECDSGCTGDVDGDGDTDVDDILHIINGFGSEYDVDDLLEAIADFGCAP